MDDVGDQILFALKVPVEPLLGDPDGPEDTIEADGVESFSIKQRVGVSSSFWRVGDGSLTGTREGIWSDVALAERIVRALTVSSGTRLGKLDAQSSAKGVG